jgi:osmoprotectant transport system ATP-binding protein
MIEFHSVSKRFADGTNAVDSLDLTIASRAITVLVGSSGCGKTTCLRMINRMVDPTSGIVTIDGVDVASGRVHELRRSIGYVIQSGGLFPHRTVADNIATVPKLNGATKREQATRVAALMELVGLEASMAKRYPHQLSGGQQQRVGVARALAGDPPILLMDEPFGAVDPVVRLTLQRELLMIQAELAKTIVFVTHDIDEAIALGDHLVVLSTGARIEQQGSPVNMLAAPASSFVSDFLGDDRTLRSLSLRSGSSVTIRSLDVVDPPWALQRNGMEWVWTDGHHQVAAATVGSAASMRSVLDGVMASPHGWVVRLDDAANVLGVSSLSDVDDAQRSRHSSTGASGPSS